MQSPCKYPCGTSDDKGVAQRHFGDMVADLVNNRSVFQNGNSLIQISNLHQITTSLCANRIERRFKVSFW